MALIAALEGRTRDSTDRDAHTNQIYNLLTKSVGRGGLRCEVPGGKAFGGEPARNRGRRKRMSLTLGAYRYAQTYLLLLRHFLAQRRWAFLIMVLAVLFNALLHPLPFILVAELLRGAQGSGTSVTLGWAPLSLQLPMDTGALLVLIVGTLAFIVSFLVGLLVNNETIHWQNAVFWQIAGGLPHIARWDRVLELGAVLKPQPLSLRIDAAVRSAFMVGRLIETGLRDFVMVLALLAVLLWLDAGSVLVLAFISLLFVPAYAIALARVVRSQAKSNAMLARWRQPIVALLRSEATQKSGLEIDVGSVGEATAETLSRGYGSQSYLLNGLNAVTTVGGIHVFAAFYAVYLAQAGSLSELSSTKITFFLLLVLMLRSGMGLVGLVSRLSRSYERLGLLRALLYPTPKVLDLRRQPEGSGFLLASPVAGSPDRLIRWGEMILLLAPDISFGYQLLPLANALRPVIAPPLGTVTHIPLLRFADVQALLSGGAPARAEQTIRLGLGCQVRLQPDEIDLAGVPVVALTWAAWERLARSQQVEAVSRNRVLVLAVGAGQMSNPLPEDVHAAVSDGRGLIAIGEAAAMRELCAVEARDWVAPRSDIEEEMEADG